MAVIFVLSSQPAELSTKVSRAVTETVQAGRIKAITPLWFSTTNLNANVRKWAHVYIYCALGVSMAVTVQLWLHRVTLRQKALLASALCMLYAAGDEFHQYFVPGRAAQLSDVAIDAMGFLPAWRRCIWCFGLSGGCAINRTQPNDMGNRGILG